MTALAQTPFSALPLGASDAPRQTLTLVPLGAQTLRITAFPLLGSGQ